MRMPAQLYSLSPRSMPIALPEHEYPEGFEERRVRRDGSMKWAGGYAFVGEAMAGETIGLKDSDDGHWHVHLGPMRLGVLHERSRTVLPLAVGAE